MASECNCAAPVVGNWIFLSVVFGMVKEFRGFHLISPNFRNPDTITPLCMRIPTNLNRITEIGKDRVLLLIGSGHMAILRQLANDSEHFCLIEPEAYLR